MHKKLSLALALLFFALPSRAKEDLDDEGFIRTWLVLAPVPLAAGATAAEAVDQRQLPDEAALTPKAGDRVPVGERQRKWKAGTFKDFIVDYNAFIGAQTDNAVGYAVAYVHCAEAVKEIELAVGFNDFGKAYLNGKEVAKQTEGGALQKDRVSVPVTLNKGRNVLVLKTINEANNFQACARFRKGDGSVFRAFSITTEP
jgi:hypothetical protein